MEWLLDSVLLLLYVPYLSGIIFQLCREPLNHTCISSSYQNSHWGQLNFTLEIFTLKILRLWLLLEVWRSEDNLEVGSFSAFAWAPGIGHQARIILCVHTRVWQLAGSPPSSMWVPGIRLRSSDWTTSTSIHSAISATYECLFLSS